MMSVIGIKEFDRSLKKLVRTGEMGKALHRGTIEVGAVAKASTQRDHLRGPRPSKLGAITGDLRRSIRKKTTPLADHVRLTITAGGGPARVDYAGIHEFGFNGAMTIASHIRSTAFGRQVQPFTVPSHTRTVSIRARPFVRPGLQEGLRRAPDIFTAEISDTLKKEFGFE